MSDDREHTPSLGYGHYLSTFEVIPLFISVCRNADGEFADYPRHVPWYSENQGG